MHARKQGLDYFVAGGDLKEVDEPKRTGGATESESSTTTLVKNKNQNPTPQTKLQFRVPEDRDAAFVPPHWYGTLCHCSRHSFMNGPHKKIIVGPSTVL